MNAITVEIPSAPNSEARGKPWVLELAAINVFSGINGAGVTQAAWSARERCDAQGLPAVLLHYPEAGLHGSVVAARMRFLCENIGHPTIIVTHSEHVLNAVRLAIKRGVLTRHDAAFYHFEGEGGETRQVIRIYADGSGNLDSWPDGFFDQLDRDLGALLA